MSTGKIMIVDDEQDVREALKLQLEGKNFKILEAEKGVKDYLVKPVNKDKLIAVVDELVAAGKDIGL